MGLSEKIRINRMAVVARASVRVVAAYRERSWMLGETLFPFLTMAAFALVYRGLHAPREYEGFVVLGGAMIAYWNSVIWSMASQFFWEKETGNLALYTIAPTSIMAILLGMALGGMTATLLRALAIVLLGILIFNVQFSVASFGLLFLTFTLTMVALYGMGMMTASLFLLLNREAWHLANLAQEPVYLLSGFYFPLRSFNFWVALGASIIPMSLGLDAMRQLVFPVGASLGFLSVPVELAVLTGLSAAFLIGAHFLLSYMERLSIREGRLTDRTR